MFAMLALTLHAFTWSGQASPFPARVSCGTAFVASARCGHALCRTLALPTRENAAVPKLPTLDADEEALLRSGKMLRWQEPPGAGGSGSGFAVQELCANADDVFEAVSAFGRYDQLIPTVRTAKSYAGPAGVIEPDNISRYSFKVSRIGLRLDVRFAVDETQRYVSWRLDRPSWVLADSTGYWHVEPCDDRPGIVRVWFAVAVRLTARVPGFIISLVSRLGLAKATRWLQNLDSSLELGECPLPDDEPRAELTNTERLELERARRD